MRKAARAGVVLAAWMLQGCLGSTVVLHVRADGTGTATARLAANREAFQAVRVMFGETTGNQRLEDMFAAPDEAALERFFGSRVRLVKSTLTPSAEGFTRETIVDFDDVTKLALTFPPLAQTLSSMHMAFGPGVPDAFIRFAVRPHENGDRLLIVRMPDSRIEPEPPQLEPDRPATPAEQQEQALIKRLARSAGVRFFVELEPLLLRTNAPARDGSRVTILDLDFGKMVDAPEFEKANPTPSPLSLQELLWHVGDIPGAITPSESEVFLEFEAPQAPPAPQAPAPPAAPDTEVYLAPLTMTGSQLTIGQPINVSNSPGYDNQPSFTPDGRSLLFTSGRNGQQTDIYKYELETKRVAQVTNTPESEYSAALTTEHGLTVVRVEADGTQRLWRFSADGRDPQVVLDRVKPVGYYAWSDERTIALFVLGTPGTNEPSTLQVADTRAGTARTVATDIGRSLLPIPGGHTVSFVQREQQADKTVLTIKELNPVTGAINMLVPAVEGTTEVSATWTADGTLLATHNDHVYSWRRGAERWTDVAALDRLGLENTSRLAISPDGKWIAIVASPQ